MQEVYKDFCSMFGLFFGLGVFRFFSFLSKNFCLLPPLLREGLLEILGLQNLLDFDSAQEQSS